MDITLSIPYRFLVPGTWEEEARTGYYGLSSQMRRALRDRVRSDAGVKVSKGTSRAIIARGLWNDDQELTEVGRVAGIASHSLPSQCALLGVPLDQVECHWTDRPETVALELMRDQIEWGYIDEGKTVRSLIHGLVFRRLYATARKIWKNDGGAQRAQSYLYQGYSGYVYLLAVDPTVTDTMLEDIWNESEKAFAASWDLFKKWNQLFQTHLACTLSEETAIQILRAIGRESLYEYAVRTFAHPTSYVNGWPDLIIQPRKGPVQFVEIKTSDRLSANQIVTFSTLRDFVGLDIRVLQLKRNTQFKDERI